ncbi:MULTISPECIES: tyrosine-type recombinase/integrase [Rhizobium]|uniref:Prophage CPZ-55 integrase n=1 Tax=Rhizobium favelukesii TaxID=348824 RepID=W6RPJ8_9HYPH|nr:MULTISPECIES: site-specific integrase [Rhizobium]MCS0461630.1 integrase arm-type DNA-binding domain-containing protein [Rhizobium favelukesii]UFS82066.1 integrase arm-type DNA-binding domain-containing protein [Rhizobium sp. T136]CDM56261.1 putative prophage CPZ-55 integrase [Rhizobium favelukesii]
MGRELNRLSAVSVKKLAPGKYADGGGLWLYKREDGGGQWVLRVTVHGRRREMGLGPIADISLKDARDDATKWRAVTRQNLDPIKERERLKREAAKRLHLLKEIAEDAFESRKAELKEDGVAGRWFSPLEIHILPKLGKVPVSEIDQTDIRDVLSPIWHKKAETARKALNRLSICLKHAAALGLEVDIQATEKARALLGQQRHKATNIPAMPWREVPAFYGTLSDGTVTHLALRLLILTGVRSGPLRFLHDSQINGDVWTIPGEAMKGRKDKTPDFRVPLSDEALEVIKQARQLSRDGFLFPSVKRGVVSDMTMSRLMERAKMAARPHGFRSSLRDWIAEATDTPHDVAETTLGHIVGGAVERAYRRTDFLEQRRTLLARWAKHVTGQTGQVIQLVKE